MPSLRLFARSAPIVFPGLCCIIALTSLVRAADEPVDPRLNEDTAAINARFNIQPAREFAAHKGAVTAMSFSADGKLLLTAGDDGAAVLWNAATGERLRQFGDASLGKINCVALSADGQFALTGGEAKTISIWNAATGAEVHKLPLDTSISVLAWSPDAARFASSGADQNLRVFDRASGKELRNDHQIIQPTALTFMPDGKHVLIGLPPRGVGHLRIEGTDSARWLAMENFTEIESIAVTSKGDLATLASTTRLFLWDLKLDEETQMYAPAQVKSAVLLQPKLQRVAITPDGKVAVHFAGDGAIDMRTTTEGHRQLFRLPNETEATATAISHNARVAASADASGKIRFWPLGDPPPNYKLIVDVFKANIDKLVNEEKFAELDALAAQLNKDQPEFPWGEGKLHIFYVTLNGRIDKPGFDYDKEFEMYDRWIAAQPKTGAGRIARGGVTVRYAFTVRGPGFGGRIPRPQYVRYEEELRKAKEFLNAGLENTPNDPEAYTWLLVAGKGLSDDKKAMYDLAEKALRIAPRYNRPQAMMCGYLAQQWHGEPGERAKYAAQVAEKIGGDDVKEMYVHIAVNQWIVDGDSIFSNDGFSWDILREGGDIILKRHPLLMQSSLNLIPNFLARAATLNDDRETARKYLKILGGYWVGSIWRKPNEFKRTTDWAFAAE